VAGGGVGERRSASGKQCAASRCEQQRVEPFKIKLIGGACEADEVDRAERKCGAE
jgi:hypothetical protein